MKKILVVDDSVAMVQMIQSLLERVGYQAVGISDPRRIERIIDSENPCLILLDVVMPERDGFQVCRSLKTSDSYKSIPIVLISSKSSSSDIYWAKQQGADGYVTKPFAAEDLLKQVRRFA